MWLPGAVLSQYLRFICPEAFKTANPARWRTLGMGGYWAIYFSAMAWLKLVTNNVPQPYLVGTQIWRKFHILTVSRMRSFTYHKLNCTVMVYTITGIQNSPPHQGCKFFFLQGRGFTKYWQVYLCDSVYQDEVWRMGCFWTSSVQRYNSSNHNAFRFVMSTSHHYPSGNHFSRIDTHST